VVVTVRVEVADPLAERMIRVGFNANVTEETCGDRLGVSVTLPEKPLRLVTVTVSDVDDPPSIASVGFPFTANAMTRSCTLTRRDSPLADAVRNIV